MRIYFSSRFLIKGDKTSCTLLSLLSKLFSPLNLIPWSNSEEDWYRLHTPTNPRPQSSPWKWQNQNYPLINLYITLIPIGIPITCKAGLQMSEGSMNLCRRTVSTTGRAREGSRNSFPTSKPLSTREEEKKKNESKSADSIRRHFLYWVGVTRQVCEGQGASLIYLNAHLTPRHRDLTNLFTAPKGSISLTPGVAAGRRLLRL